MLSREEHSNSRKSLPETLCAIYQWIYFNSMKLSRPVSLIHLYFGWIFAMSMFLSKKPQRNSFPTFNSDFRQYVNCCTALNSVLRVYWRLKVYACVCWYNINKSAHLFLIFLTWVNLALCEYSNPTVDTSLNNVHKTNNKIMRSNHGLPFPLAYIPGLTRPCERYCSLWRSSNPSSAWSAHFVNAMAPMAVDPSTDLCPVCTLPPHYPSNPKRKWHLLQRRVLRVFFRIRFGKELV